MSCRNRLGGMTTILSNRISLPAGILVFIGAATIGYCVWSPEGIKQDYDKLARIMYLYDPHACGYNLRSFTSMMTLQLQNDTKSLHLRPIKWRPPVMTVSTRLAAKTRKYVKLSVILHVFWLLVAIVLRIFRSSTKLKLLKFILAISFYACVFIVTFDLSMAIVYIAHIQQSLTKGMILRYSGWGVEMKLQRYDDFGGWYPMVASACWMRGIIIIGLNIYSCRVLQVIRRRIEKREVKKKVALQENLPIPEPMFGQPSERDEGVLYFRSGDYRPITRKPNRPSLFFF
ncbi:jg16073 [Pararge aegeria aegeria]|uniref:Jg16073 protein n=1 Tax=Pararge aegeria aegeria TaxID=348720 RepID=A0A8S4SMY9_9NEOP|nr:jg16073 [Pararge aegeria aegeria]